jgi:hypothetical protein
MVDPLDATKKDFLEVQSKKTKYMLLSCHQNSCEMHNMKINTKSSHNVTKNIYFGKSVTNKICIHDEIKSRYVESEDPLLQFK